MDTTETICFNWTAPAIWPHAVANIGATRTTEDRNKVTCASCLHTLGHQKYPRTSWNRP